MILPASLFALTALALNGCFLHQGSMSSVAFSLSPAHVPMRLASQIARGDPATGTRLNLSSGDNYDTDDGFMAALQSRISEVHNEETKLPLVVLDAMLPRQTAEIEIQNPLLLQLIFDRLKRENPTFGMLGIARMKSGEQIQLTTGVEVEIRVVKQKEGVEGAAGGEDINTKSITDASDIIKDGVVIKLHAKRRIVIEGEVENTKEGWTVGRVKYLNSQEEEEEEIEMALAATEGVLGDRMAVAKAISKCRQLSSPNATMQNNLSLVDRWIELARENERSPGQIDELLNNIGQMPSEDQPSERAFWVGALINPLPAMGVAMEIRPALLTATTANARVQVALDGILRSIKHMDGSERMW